jgi:hypothetical protein
LDLLAPLPPLAVLAQMALCSFAIPLASLIFLIVAAPSNSLDLETLPALMALVMVLPVLTPPT